MPKISIIVPVYKVEKYISKCIESIIAQTFDDWELILVDDGSPDKSGVICDHYSKINNKIRTFHKPNGGVSSARNCGMLEARGEWFYFLDSDDYIEPNTLAKCMEKMAINHTDLIVHGLVNDYLYKGESKAFPYMTFDENDYKRIIEITDKGGLLKGPVCKFFRHSLIEEHQLLFDETINYGEDTKFSFEYLQLCDTITFVPEHFYHYCFRLGDSLTRKSYSYDFWDKTAKMLLELRLPIMKRFSMPDSYYQFIRFEYLSHLTRAIYALYIDGVSKSDRLDYLWKLRNDEYTRKIHKDLKYLNRVIFLLRMPFVMDIIMNISVKCNRKIF